tara:strand:+ start:375 stop:626 length:252 start_codon:yes stop_codon:yes gene_type:complete
MITAKTVYEELTSYGLHACFEVNDSVVYFEPDEHNDMLWNYGTACNIGLLKDGTFEYDSFFSTDENLQALYEEVQEFYCVEQS